MNMNVSVPRSQSRRRRGSSLLGTLAVGLFLANSIFDWQVCAAQPPTGGPSDQSGLRKLDVPCAFKVKATPRLTRQGEDRNID